MKEKSFEKEDELLEAALEEFSANSYDDTSLNKIITKAGISKGTFYYHFKDKQALYIYLLEESVKAKWDFINEKLKDQSNLNSKGNIFESFKSQARIGLEFANKYPNYHMLGKMFRRERGNDIYEVARDILGKGNDDLLDSMVINAMERGEFRRDLPKEFILRVISFLFMNFDEVFNGDEDFELEKMIQNLDNYVSFMKYGLGN